MNENRLREFIFLLIETIKYDEETLTRWAKKNKSQTWQEKLLMSHGLIPIPHSSIPFNKSDSFLGEGVFNEAFEVLYKGKRAVAKITSESQDIKASVKLDEIGKTVPRKISRHIMKVLSVFKKPTQPDILVVEYLSPLPAGIRKAFWNSFEITPENQDENEKINKKKMLLDNEERLKNIVSASIKDQIINYDTEAFDDNKQNSLRNLIINHPSLLSWLKDDASFLDKERIQVDVVHSLRWIKTSNDKIRFAHIIRKICQSIEAYVNGKIFPKSYKNYENRIIVNESETQQVKDVLFALEWLEKYKGIRWADMHGKNLMIRPGTDTIVICDPGLFDFKEKLEIDGDVSSTN